MLTQITLIILYIVIAVFSLLTISAVLTWIYYMLKDLFKSQDVNMQQYDIPFLFRTYMYGTIGLFIMAVIAFIVEHISILW